MPSAYIFQAALLCAPCAKHHMKKNTKPAHVDLDNESSYDSGEWPKGPYSDGGGEADTPQHCDACGEFLENPLTGDGDSYVCEAAESYMSADDDGDVAPWSLIADRAENDGCAVLAQWIRHYFALGM